MPGHRDVDWFMEIVAPEPELLIPYYKLSIDYYNHAGWTCSKGQFMVSRFAWRDPNWQFSRELARRRFTTRPLPTSNFCTYANLKQICIRISRSMNSLMTDTKAAEKHAEFSDITTAGSGQECYERED